MISLWATVWAEGTKSKEFLSSVFESIVRRNKLITRKAPRQEKQQHLVRKSKPPKSIDLKGLQMFYDGSGRTNPQVGGAGFVILRDGKEVGGGCETIPFGTNNIGEFTGCLNGIKMAIGQSESLEVIGDCKILTDVAKQNKDIRNYPLNTLLSEIRAATNLFKEVTFTHVLREFNKRADAIATAASWSEEDGWEAVCDPQWDPRRNHIGTVDGKWVVQQSNLWRWLTNPLSEDWVFPIWVPTLSRAYRGLKVMTDVIYFPTQLAPDNSLLKKVPLSHEIQHWLGAKESVEVAFKKYFENERVKIYGPLGRGPTSYLRKKVAPFPEWEELHKNLK